MNKTLILLFLLTSLVSCSSSKKEKEEDPLKASMQGQSFDFLSSRPIHELIIGWSEMLADIESYSGNISALKDKAYPLRLKLMGNWNIDILPAGSFMIAKNKDEGSFTATVVQPASLFTNVGGIVNMGYIAAKLSRISGNQGTLSISGNLECLYPFTFYQKNGSIINFEKLQSSYDLDFIISNPKALSLQTLNRYSAIFKRRVGSEENASVKIKLVNKNTGKVYIGDELLVPTCAPNYGHRKNSKFLPVKAGQCLHHIQSQGNAYNLGKNKKVALAEVFLNSCERPIQCDLPARYAYLHKGKIAYVEKKDYSLFIAPKSTRKVDTSWNYNSYMGSYRETLYTAAKISKSLLEGINDLEKKPADDSLITCRWGD